MGYLKKSNPKMKLNINRTTLNTRGSAGKGGDRMTELKQVDQRDIKKQITICGVKLYGENATEFFCDCEI